MNKTATLNQPKELWFSAHSIRQGQAVYTLSETPNPNGHHVVYYSAYEQAMKERDEWREKFQAETLVSWNKAQERDALKDELVEQLKIRDHLKAALEKVIIVVHDPKADHKTILGICEDALSR